MGTVTEKLDYLNNTKEAIKTAIEDKGGTIPEDTPFREYANAIYALDTGGGIIQETIEPGTGYYYEEYYKVAFVKTGNIVTAYGQGSKWAGSPAAAFVNVPEGWRPKRQFIHYASDDTTNDMRHSIDQSGSIYLFGRNWGDVPQPLGSFNFDGWSWVVDASGEIPVTPPVGGNACFIASTPIKTVTGHKAINKLKIGDTILSYDNELDKAVEADIINIKTHEDEELYTITTETGNTITGTKYHTIFIIDEGYTQLRFVKPGHKILNDKFKYVEVQKIEKIDGAQTVYDIATSLGTYFVGKDGLLVHTEQITLDELE